MLPGIGIFGTGNLVKILIPYLKNKGFKVEAIWGQTLQKAEKTAKELDIPYYTNKIDDVLLRKDVDLIFIMCSPHLHSQISVKALGIGKHVLCDKPAGLNQDEALKMVNASQYYPSLIAIINHSLRFLPVFVQMKRLISEGYLGGKEDITVCDIRVQMGPLYMDKYNWFCEETMGGGVVTLVGSHVIDLITYLIDQTAVRVHGVIKNFIQTTEHIKGIRRITSPDYCTFQMIMSRNAVVNVTLNTHVPCTYNQEILICGKEGYLIVRGGDLYGFKKPTIKEDVIYLDIEDLKYESLHLSNKNTLPRPYIKGLFKMIASLKEAFLPVEDKSGWIKEPVANASTFEDNLHVQSVINALKKSSRNRTWEYVEVVIEDDLTNKNLFLNSDPLIAATARLSGFSL